MILPSVHELIKPPMLPLDPAPTNNYGPLALLLPVNQLAPDYFHNHQHARLNLMFGPALAPFLTPQPPHSHRALLPLGQPSQAAGYPVPQQYVTQPPAAVTLAPVYWPPLNEVVPPHYIPAMPMYNPYMQHAAPAFPQFPLDYPEKRKVIKRRTRTGCLTCRKRRIKCDERKPKCHNCERLKKVCMGYEQGPTLPLASAPARAAAKQPQAKELEKMLVENLLV